MQTFRCIMFKRFATYQSVNSASIHPCSFTTYPSHRRWMRKHIPSYNGTKAGLAVHHRVVVRYGDKQALAQSNHLQLELLMRLGTHQIWLCSENWPFIWPVAVQLSYDQKREAKQIGRLTSVLVFQWSDTSINFVDHHVTLQQPLSLPTIYPQIGIQGTMQLSSWPLCCSQSAFKAVPDLGWMQPSGEPSIPGEEPRHWENIQTPPNWIQNLLPFWLHCTKGIYNCTFFHI